MSQSRKVHFEGNNRDISKSACSSHDTPEEGRMQNPNLGKNNQQGQKRSNSQQNSQHSGQQAAPLVPAQAAAYSHPGYPYAYPFGWTYMHPVNPLNPAPMPPMNPMYGMYYPTAASTVQSVPSFVAPSVASTPTTQTSDNEPKTKEPVVAVTSAQTTPVQPNKRGAFNLDDPEELEKWKAERRKRFPSASKPKIEEATDEAAEEGEVCDVEEEDEASHPIKPAPKIKPIKKQTCKYFASGMCKNGDACTFAHDKASSSGQTVFETLQRKQEREDLLKFYNILKCALGPLPFVMMTLNESCDFLNSTQGLDKLYRLVSYAAKLAAALAEKEGKEAFSLNDAMNRLGRNISHTRTVMRLVGLLHNAKLTREWITENFSVKKELSLPSWKAFRSLTRVLTNYTYLPCDHLVWMGRERIVYLQDDWIGFLSRLSAQSWFVGLVVELIELIRNVRELTTELKAKLREGKEPVSQVMQKFKQQLLKLSVKALLIAGDLPLSINYSRKEQFMSPLAVGVCGTLSSMAALYMRWETHFGPK